MITCFIGTRAQLIKMAPVVVELERRSVPFRLVLTGQHKETMGQLLADFDISTSPCYLYQGTEVTGVAQMGLWFLGCFFKCLRHANRFLPRTGKGRDVILVHGDTFSTLLGAMVGTLRGMQIAHIEAGLRSHNIFHPFPEELTRLAVTRLADLAFCPGEWACNNLDSASVRVVDTGQNTLVESLAYALNACHEPFHPGPDFGIVSIHRFENIFRQPKLARIVHLIEQAAECYPLSFVLHPATRKKLAHFGLLERLKGNPRIDLVPRMGYLEFVRLMRKAKFVITDGGGNQEELSYLGVPTLLMRRATERREGMGTTATLCNFDSEILHRFLAQLPGQAKPLEPTVPSPTGIIVDRLMPYA